MTSKCYSYDLPNFYLCPIFIYISWCLIMFDLFLYEILTKVLVTNDYNHVYEIVTFAITN